MVRKIFCNKCEKEIKIDDLNNLSELSEFEQPIGINNEDYDFCRDCYSDFCIWLKGEE